MAHDVDQLQVVPGEQQAVEVVQVDLGALVTLQSFQQGGNDGPLLLNPGDPTKKKKKKCLRIVFSNQQVCRSDASVASHPEDGGRIRGVDAK